jgi:UDP-N-acetylmuramyl tripeptide synthase
MPKKTSIVVGKLVRAVSRLKGGAGSALPGLVVEKIDSDFVKDCLGSLPRGVVVVSGSNGKTTTTKIIVELLQAQGLKVFTNKTGSNFVRGVIAALLEKINLQGKVDADIAVLELDEAHAVKFVEVVKPDYSLLLNVMRDQLDRFGEIDITARHLEKVANATKKTVVINREDPRLSRITPKAKTVYFGLSEGLRAEFPNDDEMFDKSSTAKKSAIKADVELSSLKNNNATFNIDGKKYETSLSLEGVYNALNSAAALAMVRAVIPEAETKELLKDLSKISSAFGRGESFVVGDSDVKLLLVKNPAGFQLSLKSFSEEGRKVMIAINDEYADGRDMSWLWNVDFSELRGVETVSGVRAADMALRLKYDEVPVKDIEPDLAEALKNFVSLPGDKYIFATYTAMLKLRKILAGRSLI